MQFNSDEPQNGDHLKYDPNSFNALFAKLSTKIDNLHDVFDVKIDQLNKKIDGFASDQKQQNASLDQKVEKVSDRLDDLDKGIDIKIGNLNKAIEDDITDLEKRVISLEQYKYWLIGATAIGTIVFGMISKKFNL